MKKIIINVSLIFIAFAVQNCVFPFIPFLSASPNFMVILVFSFGFIYGSWEGMLYGVLAGVLMDLFYSGSFGFFTLIFMWIGFINGLLSRFFYEDYIVLPLAMCAVNEFVYNICLYVLRFLIRGKTDILFYTGAIIIPEIIITLIVTLFLYRFLLNYSKRIKEIDKKEV